MKTTYPIRTALATLLALAFACSSCTPPDQPEHDQSKKNVEMYASVWDDILNKGKIDLINETYFTEDVTAVSNPENIVGIENFKAYYQNYLNGFSEITFTIENILSQGDDAAKHWRFKGRHTGDFFGIPATGRFVDIEGATIAKMRNGRIAREQDFMDNAAFMQQLGLVSDPANITIIDRGYAAFAKGDIPTVLDAMDPEIVWNEAEGNKYADGNPYLGPEAIKSGVFDRILQDHKLFEIKDIELHEMSNNQVLATLRYNGELKTGGQYDVQAAHLWTFRDGKITAFQQYVDTRQLADAASK